MQGVGKVAISDQYLAIARKRLKIDSILFKKVKIIYGDVSAETQQWRLTMLVKSVIE